MTEPGQALLLTMSDVAALARVRRPVVSVWRTRAAGTDAPFPAPVTQLRGQELFDARQVGAWLTDTHRGNNPDAAADAAAHAVLNNETRTAETTFRAVTALLALRSVTGGPLGALTAQELLDAADEHDPDDALIYREMESLGDALEPLAGYVDDLVEASYGEAAAFERLMADRFKRELRELSDTALSDPALELMAQTATALAATLPGDPIVVDATGSAGDIILAIVRAESARGDLTVVTANADNDAARLLRRRLLVHGITREGLEVHESGAFTRTGPAVHIAQFPVANHAATTATAILSAIDQIVLQMDDDQLAVILAPAAVLSDAGLPRETDGLRSAILRSGRVRAIVRLPAGVIRHKPQQPQALWVLGAAHAHVELAERWTMIADLTATALEPTVIADLVSDLIASLGDRGTVRAHAFRFARFVLTRTLLASRDSLVAGARSVPLVRTTGGAELAVRVDGLLVLLKTETDAASGLAGLVAESATSTEPLSPTLPALTSSAATQTVEQLLAAKHLRYLPGNRIDPEDIARGETDVAGIRLIGPAEVLGDLPLGRRRIDRLRFAAGYPAGRVTEPGDVIFTTSPRPAAIVDREGTSVVLFPARILRINPDDPNGLLSVVVAADITAVLPGNRRWRRWPMRQVRPAQRGALAVALASVRLEQERAHARLAHLDELAALLMAGVTAGSLTVSQTVDPQISHAFAPSEGTN